MVRVLLDDVLLADCDRPVTLEGNYYFPPDTVRRTNLSSSNTSTASYYSAGGVKDVAWYYPDPKTIAAHIKNHVAFYKNKVVIIED